MTSKYGKNLLPFVKSMVAIAYATCIVILFVIMVWIKKAEEMGSITIATQGWELPIQLGAFLESPYAMTYLEYHIAQIGLLWVGAVSFALFITMTSSFFKNTFANVMVSGIVYGTPFFLIDMVLKRTGVPVWMNELKYYTFVYQMQSNLFFESFQAIPIGGWAILLPVAAALFAGGVMIVSVVLNAIHIRKWKTVN